ncbi:MAG TPA: hypothetical protein VNR37_06840 [Microbacteriaceae bacterium]|nr:hypothetical protein [Microbacteriaceae bacterium]
MGFWDSLFGVSRQDPPRESARRRPPTEDEYAVDRYRYLLRTAPPDRVEDVHAEAFAKLTPEQRRILHEQLTAAVMVEDRPADDEPRTLARAATRAELRQPGTMEHMLGAQGGGAFGGFGSSMLGTIAGYVVASTIMQSFLPVYDPGVGGEATYADGADAGGDAGLDSGFDFGGDFGGGFDF